MIARPPSARLRNKKVVDDRHHHLQLAPLSPDAHTTQATTTTSSMTGINNGRWNDCEKAAFLRALRRYGKGQWKQIQSMIPTRTTTQTKSHAQVVLKRIENGEDVFQGLSECDEAMRGEEKLVALYEAEPYVDPTCGYQPTTSQNPSIQDQEWKPPEYDAMRVLSALRTIMS